MYNNLIAYQVDDNVDLFHKEIKEGIKTVQIGTIGSINGPLVLIGGNRKYKIYIYCLWYIYIQMCKL